MAEGETDRPWAAPRCGHSCLYPWICYSGFYSNHLVYYSSFMTLFGAWEEL